MSSAAAGRSAPSHRPTALLPAFLTALPELLPAGVAAAAVLLVALVDVAAYTTALAVTLGGASFLVVAVAVVRLVRRTPTVARASRYGGTLDAVAVLATAVWIAGNAHYSSQHLVLDRDPAVYNTAAQWLVHHRSLAAVSHYQQFGVTVQTVRQGWSSVEGISTYYPQGMHGVVAVAALVGRIFGSGALLKTNVVLGGLGILAFYGFARTILPRGWALFAMVALGCTLPQIHFSRDTYSEPLGQLAIWVGLTLFARARAHGGWWPLAITGFVFGASMTSRVDAYLGVVALMAMAVVLAGTAAPGRRVGAVGRVGVLLVSAAVPFVVGLVDLRRHTGTYYIDLRTEILSVFKLDVVVVVLAVVVVALVWWSPTRRLVVKLRRSAGIVAALATVVVFASLAVRPVVESHHGFAADGVTWLGYYGGPLTVTLGLLGIAELVRRGVGGRVELLPLLGLVLPVTVGYLVRPDISPDQIWAERRYLPVVWPALMLGVALLMAAVLRWAVAREPVRGRLLRAGAAGVAGLVAAATLAVPLVVDRPLLRVREYVPDLRLFERICAVAGPHAALLIVDSTVSDVTGKLDMPAVLSYCNVPTAWVSPPTASTLATSAAAVATVGRQLWVVTRSPSSVTQVHPLPAGAPATVTVTSRMWEKVYTRAPKDAGTVTLSLYAGRVASDGRVTFVTG